MHRPATRGDSPDAAAADGGSEAATNSTCFDFAGKRKNMRLFVCHEHGRDSMDVPEGKTVGDIKRIIKERFKIRVDKVQLGDINFERNTLVLSYAGAELNDKWVLSDMGIKPGSTIRAFVKEEVDPVLYLRVGYSDEIIPILDRIKLRNFSVAALRTMASKRTGLPVGVFRLTAASSSSSSEMFDCHSLDAYEVKPGDTIGVETWDGWSELLKLASLGYTGHLIDKVSTTDDVLAKFQLKVALYMAAHFGQVELSTTLTRQYAVRCDEAVGPHPLKQWCTMLRHPDLRKAPIHEAVEAGQLSVLRSFVHHNVCSVMARDGNGLQPLNLALRQKQKACASFLLTKQWSRISYNNSSVPLAIFARMKNWSEKARDKVSVLHGQEKSSLKKKQIKDYPLVGQGVYIDGYSKQQLNSSAKSPLSRSDTALARSLQRYYTAFSGNPEEHFREVTQGLKLPKQKTKWAKMSGNKDPDNKEADTEPGRLPPLKHQQRQKMSSTAKSNALRSAANELQEQQQQQQQSTSRPSSSRSVAVNSQQQQQQPQQKETGVSKKASNGATKPTPASLLSKGNDAAIPLPLNSVDDTPRPFLHLKRGEVNEVQQALQRYYSHRGIGPREYAIQCLSVAQNFKEKPWLHQVRLAMTFTETGVRKMTCKNSHSLLSPNMGAE